MEPGLSERECERLTEVVGKVMEFDEDRTLLMDTYAAPAAWHLAGLGITQRQIADILVFLASGELAFVGEIEIVADGEFTDMASDKVVLRQVRTAAGANESGRQPQPDSRASCAPSCEVSCCRQQHGNNGRYCY